MCYLVGMAPVMGLLPPDFKDENQTRGYTKPQAEESVSAHES